MLLAADTPKQEGSQESSPMLEEAADLQAAAVKSPGRQKQKHGTFPAEVTGS